MADKTSRGITKKQEERVRQILCQLAKELGMELSTVPSFLQSPQAARNASLVQILRNPAASVLYNRGMQNGRTEILQETKRAINSISVFPQRVPQQKIPSLLSFTAFGLAHTNLNALERQTVIQNNRTASTSSSRIMQHKTAGIKRQTPSAIRRKERKWQEFLAKKFKTQMQPNAIANASTKTERSQDPSTEGIQAITLPLSTPLTTKPQLIPLPPVIEKVVEQSTSYQPSVQNDVPTTIKIEEVTVEKLNHNLEELYSCPTLYQPSVQNDAPTTIKIEEVTVEKLNHNLEELYSCPTLYQPSVQNDVPTVIKIEEVTVEELNHNLEEFYSCPTSSHPSVQNDAPTTIKIEEVTVEKLNHNLEELYSCPTLYQPSVQNDVPTVIKIEEVTVEELNHNLEEFYSCPTSSHPSVQNDAPTTIKIEEVKVEDLNHNLEEFHSCPTSLFAPRPPH
ncbi:uncharacterized protein LOC126901581 [Daktulosphaira vitifoliae]|uniref:uncharacterized protein LOC126901581 n=1 Tax=Daktulosphaira vitifoliae TaxID=58002 RepID=UPI0021A9B10D|nr:uncharacterized protein LOC126901581 [Daktulosphaira vitifoliae]